MQGMFDKELPEEEIITREDLTDMIIHYNLQVDAFEELGIATQPRIALNADIRVGELLFIQGLMISQLTKHIEQMKGGQEVKATQETNSTKGTILY